MAIKRLFSDWNKEELEATFGLTRCRTVTVFDEWLALSATQHVDELEETLLIRLRDVLLDQADAWNEIELAEYFILLRF